MAGRRPQGEGTIYFDEKRDRWIGAVKIAGKRRKVSGKDRTEARAKLAELLAAKTTGTAVTDGAITVNRVIDDFLERDLPTRSRAGHPLAPSTIETHTWAANMIRDELGGTRVVELSVDDIEVMFDRLARRPERPLARASLVKVRSTLQQSFDFAKRRGKVAGNPAREATISPSARRGESRRSLSPIEARTLLASLPGERLGTMYSIMLRVGLRPGEAAGLRWEDLHDDLLNVHHGVRVGRTGQATVVDATKTSSSARTIRLPADVVHALATHRADQREERMAAAVWVDEKLIFTSPTGNVLSPPNVRRDLAQICAAAGITVISPNELRHSCASLLLDTGVAAEHVADLLGHRSTRMLHQHYRHALKPAIDTAVEADWTKIAR